jgi:hypothetical protein
MSSLQTHPEEGQLLRYLDGELPGRESRQVRGHLESCWQCRSAVEELEGAIAACMDYRKEVLQGHLPPPPTPWADLTAGFARIDSEVAADGWGIRLGNWLTGPRLQRWAFSAAAVALVAVGVYYQVVHTPSVQAATLLRRAVAAAHATPVPAKPVRMRGNFTSRTAIAAKLRAAHYPEGEPLSPISFQQWRESLPQKHDEIATVSNPEVPSESWFRIKTDAPDGDLAAASITLRASDFHPVGSRFEFRDQEWVEYNEFSETPATDGGTPAVSRLDTPTRRVVPSRPSALPSGESASISEELRVLAALHGIGADLGDPLDITRSGGRVLVSGVGIPAGRQREIHRALDPLPNVAVQFVDPASGAPAQSLAETTEVKPDSTHRSPIQTRLEQQLGSRAAFERFSIQTLDELDNAMAHAYALRSLAQRFPEGTAMSDSDRSLLADLARTHLETLTSQINELHRTLAPVLVSLGGATAQGRPVTNVRAWQTAAEDTFAASRRVEVLLSSLVGATVEAPNAHVPSDLLAAFADLRAAIEDCQKRL